MKISSQCHEFFKTQEAQTLKDKINKFAVKLNTSVDKRFHKESNI